MSNRCRDKEKILKLYYLGSSPTQLSKEYHVPQSTLFSWVKKYPKSVVISSSHQQIKGWSRLMSHCKKLEAEVTFLKRTAIKKIPLRERLRMIDDEYGKESLHVQCEALDVSRGTYLNHKNRNKRDNTWFKKREAEYSAIIAKIFEESGYIYGAKKITAIMQHGGKPVTVKYVRRLMAESGLISIRSTSSKDRWMVSRNLTRAAHASSDFNVSGINQIWVSDTSAVRVHGRFYYVCVYIDLFSRKVVGWKIGNNNSTQLVKKTFMAAYESRGKIETRAPYRKKIRGNSPLSNTVICGVCGGFYGHKVWHNHANTDRYDVWYCNDKYDSANKCPSPVLREDELKIAIEAVLRRLGKGQVKYTDALWRKTVETVTVYPGGKLEFRLKSGETGTYQL